jgi:hypothetical protein
MTPEYNVESKIYHRDVLKLMNRVAAVLLAVEASMAEEDGVKPSRSLADATASPPPALYEFSARDAEITLAAYMRKASPSLKRLIETDNSIPALNGLRLWFMIGNLADLSGRPEDMRDGINADITLWGNPSAWLRRAWTKSNQRKWLFRSVIVGSTVVAGGTAYVTSDHWRPYLPPFLGGKPAAVAPADPGGKTTQKPSNVQTDYAP